MNWTQPLCGDCWVAENPDRVPAAMREQFADVEICSTCGMPTTSGIYVRKHPSECNYPASDNA